MASYSEKEIIMMAKYIDDKHLIDNEEFWEDVPNMLYEKPFALPLVFCKETVDMLHGMLKCPAGECGICCETYQRIDISQEDLERMRKANVVICYRFDNEKPDKLYLDVRGGCQYLKDKVCSIYEHRPTVCREFPIQPTREAIDQDGKPFQQMMYRVKCKPAADVTRQIIRDAMKDGDIRLLPDLSIIPIL